MRVGNVRLQGAKGVSSLFCAPNHTVWQCSGFQLKTPLFYASCGLISISAVNSHLFALSWLTCAYGLDGAQSI